MQFMFTMCSLHIIILAPPAKATTNLRNMPYSATMAHVHNPVKDQGKNQHQTPPPQSFRTPIRHPKTQTFQQT